jgi:hypothetical protein
MFSVSLIYLPSALHSSSTTTYVGGVGFLELPAHRSHKYLSRMFPGHLTRTTSVLYPTKNNDLLTPEICIGSVGSR